MGEMCRLEVGDEGSGLSMLQRYICNYSRFLIYSGIQPNEQRRLRLISVD
jgi:hypothetical protein